jgi:hypothetical protein
LKPVIHPPVMGIVDVHGTERYIDRLWINFWSAKAAFFERSVPLVVDYLHRYWSNESEMNDENVSELLRDGRIHCWCLDLEGDNWCYVEGNDLVCGRDVVIVFSHALTPIRVQLDG